MHKKIFILNEILSIMINYLMIFFLIYFLSKKLILSLIITLVIFIIFFFITYFADQVLKTTDFNEKDYRNEEIEQFISDINKKYNYNLKIKYIEISELGPAWISGNNVFINLKYAYLDELFLGVVAHEVGHLETGVCKWTYLDSMKPLSILSRIFKTLTILLYNKEKKDVHILSYMAFCIYLFISLIDMILIFPLMRKDEIIANKNAVKYSYGEELRCYYGVYCFRKTTSLERMLDLIHPTAKVMITKLNKELNVKKNDEEIYSSYKKVYKATISTKTYKFKDSIKEVIGNKFTGDKLVKINLNNVEKIGYSLFDNLKALEEIIVKTDILTKQNILRIKNLKEIKTSNVDVYNKLKEYQLSNLRIILDLKIDTNERN